ncbi:MAG: N-succinyldiaminopimelate aminotransferase [Candidatus Azotimanducaceae bacterium]
MNKRILELQDYPFTRLRALISDIEGAKGLRHIPLSLGEPKHAPPDFVIASFAEPGQLAVDLATYPATKGTDALRGAIATWTKQRFGVPINPETEVLPVNGTREALFSFAQAMLSGDPSWVMMPNPFYQIYEGAALLAGARPMYLNNDAQHGYQQQFESLSEEAWAQTELVYICSPGNPTGQVMSSQQMQWLVNKALEHNFIIAADECYSEIYTDESKPPASLLNACHAVGNPSYKNCVVFHSLSKRSNLPGLRSGFVAGDAALMATFLQYRTYHGCAMSAHHQTASQLAWQDEKHVVENRSLYRAKFTAVEEILSPVLPLNKPDGGFYHWVPTPVDDREFCRQLLAEQNVTVVPGQFLGREVNGHNPGANHIRVAWVSPLDQCIEAAERIVNLLRQ